MAGADPPAASPSNGGGGGAGGGKRSILQSGGGGGGGGVTVDTNIGSRPTPTMGGEPSAAASPTGVSFDEDALLNSPSLIAAVRRSGRVDSSANASVNAGKQSLASPLRQSSDGGSAFAAASQVKYAQEQWADAEGSTSGKVDRRHHHRSASGTSRRAGNASVASTARSAGTIKGSKVIVVNTKPSWARDEPSSGEEDQQQQQQQPADGVSRRRSRSASRGGRDRADSEGTGPQRSRREQKRRDEEDAATRKQGSSVNPAHCDDTDDEYEDISDDAAATARSPGDSARQSTSTDSRSRRDKSRPTRDSSFWVARKTKRRIKRHADVRDGGDGVSGYIAARDAAERYGKMDFGGTYRQNKHQREGSSGRTRAAAPEQGDVRPRRRSSDEDERVYSDAPPPAAPARSSGEESSEATATASSPPPGDDLPSAVMRARLKPRRPQEDLKLDTSFATGGMTLDEITRHQPLSPGWASPWRAETPIGGRQSIEVGRYRFHPSGADGYFPHRKSSGRSINSEKGEAGMMTWTWWRKFLLYDPFGPLFTRLVNMCFTSATLAVAIKVHLNLKAEQATTIVGASPIMAIIFSPLTLVHVAFQTYLEYFGRPIGIWSVRSKLLGTLLEIVFVALWAAETSLAFDNYFTSPLVCYPFNSPFTVQREICTSDNGPSLANDSRKPYICRLQAALIGLCFASLLLYIMALTISLFRIFVRVTARSG